MKPVHDLCACLFSLVAGMLLLSLAGPAVAQEITIDNSDAEFTVLAGSWTSGAYGQPNGVDYVWALTSGYDPGTPWAEVEWRPSLPQSGPYQVSVWYVPGANRANNVTYTVHHAGGSTPIAVNQQINGQTWFSLGSFNFNAGTGGYVTLDNDANASVVIADAVRFTSESGTAVDLSMAVSPTGAGTTTPAVGGPYARFLNEQVSISASAAVGYAFDHWQVSGGAAPAAPSSASTTVLMDQSKTVTAVFTEQPAPEGEFRAFWADAFHAGFKSTAEIDAMINRALIGNYNAIIPEVLAFQDTTGGGHGAYWNSAIVPKAADIAPGLDPLAYLVQQAHANGLEVHPWLVAFRVSAAWPPSGNALLAAHPEWLMVPRAAMGNGPATVSSYYTFDPGSPHVQDYLMGIVRELCTNYAVDGIHWDYIRYTTTDAGYPADNNCTDSTLRRFQQITGYVGTPAADGVAAWNDFRRRTITEFVRRAMFEVPTCPNPRQPLRHTAAVVTWYPANTDFHLTSPYAVFSDWEYWQSLGYLDATVPMTYFDESSYPVTYRAWVDNSVTWANSYGRHTYIGPGIYMNTFAASRTQLLYARSAGAHGFSTYSYTSTNDAGTPWADWYPYVAAEVFTEPVPTPVMPWRDPATAAQGYVYGRVFDASTGAGIDNAQVTIAGQAAVQTDGNGYYLFARTAAAAGGTDCAVAASKTGYPPRTRPGVVFPAGTTRVDIPLGPLDPADYDADGDVDTADFRVFSECLTGPNQGPIDLGCEVFDTEPDGDVDLQDFAAFQELFTGV